MKAVEISLKVKVVCGESYCGGNFAAGISSASVILLAIIKIMNIEVAATAIGHFLNEIYFPLFEQIKYLFIFKHNELLAR
jgi:hypothetical protein